MSSTLGFKKGFVQGTKARPRGICGATYWGNGVLHALQHQIFPLLKEMFPGFIQAMSPTEVIARVNSRIKKNWIAISIDASAFDSAQWREMMRANDHLWRKLRPAIEKIVDGWIEGVAPHL